MREVTIVEIKNPITHYKRSRRKYTDFEITLKTNSKAFTLHKSSVRRRYSDFVWLRNWLSENNEGFSSIRKTPSLPPKKLIGRFEKDFIETRMRGLQRFLRKVLEHNVFLSDKALHLFLQSNLSVEQMENYLTGKPVDCDDCIDNRKIMNCEDSPNIGKDQRSLICRLSWKSSLDNTPKLQEISEDTENSAGSEASRRVTADEEQAAAPYMAFKRMTTNDDGGSDGEKSEDIVSREYEICSYEGSTDQDELCTNSEEGCSQEKSFSDSLPEDQQDSQLTSSCNDMEPSELSCSPMPIVSALTPNSDSDYSTLNIGDTSSCTGVIGNTPPERPTVSDSTIFSVRSLPDTSTYGFIAAVPIVRSPSL